MKATVYSCSYTTSRSSFHCRSSDFCFELPQVRLKDYTEDAKSLDLDQNQAAMRAVHANGLQGLAVDQRESLEVGIL